MHWEEQHKTKHWGTYPEIDLVRKAKHHMSLITVQQDVRPKCLEWVAVPAPTRSC